MTDPTMPSLPASATGAGAITGTTVNRLCGTHWSDPFALLGAHVEEGVTVVRTFQPGARSVIVLPASALASGSSASASTSASAPVAAVAGGDAVLLATLTDPDGSGLFSGVVPGLAAGDHYVLCITWPGSEQTAGADTRQFTEDPYSFGPLLGELDLHLLAEGTHRALGRCLGAQAMTIDGVPGTRFALWAPNAWRVSVVGDFNGWDGRRHPMCLRPQAGVWELFVPRVGAGTVYKYELLGADGSLQPLKADPVARATELPPKTGSVVAHNADFAWQDAQWMAGRAARQQPDSPLSIYEVHAASWMRVMEEGARNLDWDELTARLIPYVLGMGFTHVEFLPIMEHPFGGSWGYQPLGQFAPSARFGTPHGFARFVDSCHRAGLGVILDWVPAHFPADAHGLARFDGTALYEHQDPREGYHQDWNTLIFNLGRNEVCGFLIASALEWLEHFHIDGLRVDAVASMLYRDYSRQPGQWIPNIHGGRENLESVAFLRNLNQVVAERCPGALMIAEESTAWPGVSAPVAQGGLGFDYKWNMGWMHDTLHYMALDPLYRRHHHHEMTFGLVYAFSEKFVLPISHDEVVHGKGSLVNKMPGADLAQRLANLRAYLGFMWTHPGKKLLFMGCELAQENEWNHDASVQWDLIDDPRHRGVQTLVRDLNHVYTTEPALHACDTHADGFAWLVGDDSNNSVFAFLRQDTAGNRVLVVSNLTPSAHSNYRIGIPDAPAGKPARWSELLCSAEAVYGGDVAGPVNARIVAQTVGAHGFARSIALQLPALSTLILKETR
jgi:1,4-alpha-glucan branching enzyme